VISWWEPRVYEAARGFQGNNHLSGSRPSSEVAVETTPLHGRAVRRASVQVATVSTAALPPVNDALPDRRPCLGDLRGTATIVGEHQRRRAPDPHAIGKGRW
jgi:hypothetical protein